jgi:CubicO group peptidase (beta-lactamase class C family)
MTYCNAGFDLAGRAIELVTGQRFEDVVRDRIFTPLGMKRSTYFASEAIRHAVAVGHISPPDQDTYIADPWPIPRRSGPAGGISSNVAELIRFARMHINKGEFDGARVISEASATAMQTFQNKGGYPLSWGLGWILNTVGGERTIEHGGGTNGFMTRLLIVPDRDFAVAIFTNGNHGAAVHGKVGSTILDRFLGLKNPAPERIKLDDSALEKFAGSYKHLLAEYAFTVDNGGYHVEWTSYNAFNPDETFAHPPFRMEPISETLFVVTDGELAGAVGEFFTNPDGSVRFLRMGNRLGYPVK